MSIAIITPGVFPVPPIYGGSVEIVVNGFGEELANHMQTIIFSKKVKGLPTLKKKDNRIDIRIPYYSAKHYLSEVEKYVRSTKPSCLQIENRPLYIPYLKEKWPHLKMILSLHSLTFVDKLSEQTANHSLSQADLILVNSKFIKRELSQRYPALRPKIQVSYLGIEDKSFADRFSAKGERLRMKWRSKFQLHGKQVMLFVGRLIPEKGLHMVLEAFPNLLNQHPNLHLLVVGSSHYGRQLNTEYVKKLKKLVSPIANHVTYANYLAPHVVPEIYQVADLVVTPSVGKEAFCLVNVEAAISGIPIITTDVGGIPEVVRHQHNGFLVSPSAWVQQFPDYVSELLIDKELNSLMGKNGQTHAQKRFTWKNNVHRYLKIYRKLMTNTDFPHEAGIELDPIATTQVNEGVAL